MSLLGITLLVLFRLDIVVQGKPYVTVQQGRLFGETTTFNEDGTIAQVDVFKGIPFAEPPVRFSPPTPKANWVGDWNATYYRPACFQPVTDEWKPWFHPTVDEDCLYLNIYAPHPKPSNAAVMVYIHGGSFDIGTGMIDDLSGAPIAAFEEIITVVINYRLNVFGFFSTGDDAAPGNFGLLDQAEALKWVKANIGGIRNMINGHAFGGDPSRVTIFGNSAGAASVDLHRFSSYSREIFDKAIIQSGVASAFWSFRDNPTLDRKKSFSLGRRLGCDSTNTSELVECLRSVRAPQLFEANVQNSHSWRPNADGLFLNESPKDLLVRGDYKHSPIMTGFGKDEGTLWIPSYYPDYLYKKHPPFISQDGFNFMTDSILQSTGEFTNDLIIKAVKHFYVDQTIADNASADYFLSAIPIYADVSLRCPILDVVRAHSYSSEPVYQYFFTHVPTTSFYERGDNGTGWFMAGHVEEIPFVFGWGFNPSMKEDVFWTAEERNLSRKMMKFWANFAKTGDPSKASVEDPPGTGDMEWPSFTIPEMYYKELSLDMSIGRGVRANECAFWNDFLADLQMTLVSIDKVQLQWREEFITWMNAMKAWRREFSSYQGTTCAPE